MIDLTFSVQRGSMQNLVQRYAENAQQLGITDVPELFVDTPTHSVRVQVSEQVADAFRTPPAKIGELYVRPEGVEQLLHYLRLATR